MVNHSPIVHRNSLVLVFLSDIDTLTDHELVRVNTCMDGLNSLIQVANDLLSGSRGSNLNLVDLAVCHFDNAMSEVFEADIVSNHDRIAMTKLEAQRAQIDNFFPVNSCRFSDGHCSTELATVCVRPARQLRC